MLDSLYYKTLILASRLQKPMVDLEEYEDITSENSSDIGIVTDLP